MDNPDEHVKALIEKAGKSTEHNAALHFSQAALNVAHALCALATIKGHKFN